LCPVVSERSTLCGLNFNQGDVTCPFTFHEVVSRQTQSRE
jgi:hypothetical protein